MKLTHTLEADGTLVIIEDAEKVNDRGEPQTSCRRIMPWQVAAHRRDPALEAALPANIKAALDAPPVKA
jgi:hypothetical protein